MNKKIILVTGAAGFIGYHTCRKFLDLGFGVIGVDNMNDYYDPELKRRRLKELKKEKNSKNFIFLKCDFANFAELNRKLTAYKTPPNLPLARGGIQCIVHLGAQAGVRYSIENPFAYAQSNYIGTLNVFEFAKQNKIPHVIFASTSSVYGLNKKQPFEEKDTTDTPISTYAATKKGTEALAHAYWHLFGIKMTGLRFFTVYGPWGRPDMALFKFAKNILQDKEIEVYNNGKMSRSFTYIDDIVNGIVGAINTKKAFAIYNLGGDKVVKLKDFIKLIEKYLNKKAKIKFVGMQAGDMKETIASTKLSGKEIGYKAKVGIDDGVKNFCDWFLTNKTWLLKLKAGKQ